MARTRLEQFLQRHAPQLTSIELVRRSGASVDHLRRVKAGKANPTIAFARRLRDAAEQILRRPVALAEMFDLGDERERA